MDLVEFLGMDIEAVFNDGVVILPEISIEKGETGDRHFMAVWDVIEYSLDYDEVAELLDYVEHGSEKLSGMKKVYFETRLSKQRIEVRLCNSSYIRLTTHKKYNPFTLYVHDDWAYSWKEQPEIFTPYQLKRLKSFEKG